MEKVFDRNNPPRLDRTVRAGALNVADVREAAQAAHPVAVGLALLWHDHWDAAHVIAQTDEGERDHDLLHAIAHRREGDFSNAGYWFRGVGKHSCFGLIAARVAPLLAGNPVLLARLLPVGTWNPQAFLKAVEKSVKKKSDADDESLLRAIQAEEIIAYYDWLMGRR
jgi:hypothetical protein